MTGREDRVGGDGCRRVAGVKVVADTEGGTLKGQPTANL